MEEKVVVMVVNEVLVVLVVVVGGAGDGVGVGCGVWGDNGGAFSLSVYFLGGR